MLRGEKKSIVNKVVLESAVTCLIWPPAQSHYVFGLADGKVCSIVTKPRMSRHLPQYCYAGAYRWP